MKGEKRNLSSSKISEISRSLSLIDDSRVPLGYLTVEAANLLGLKEVLKLKVRKIIAEAAQQISEHYPAWYFPQTRELAFTQVPTLVKDELSSKEGKLEISTHEVQKLIRVCELATLKHELEHNAKSLKEGHYYFGKRYDLLANSLEFLENESVAFLIDGIIGALSTSRGSSLPQEYLGVKAQEEYISSAIGFRLAVFRDQAKNRFLALDSTDSSGIKQQRCIECQYLLPFIAHKESENWDIPISEWDFTVGASSSRVDSDGFTWRGINLFPNAVWLAAASTCKKEINEADDQRELLFQKVREIVPYRQRQPSTQPIIRDVTNIEIASFQPEDFEKSFLDTFIRIHLEDKKYFVFPLLLDPRIRRALDGCYIVWRPGGERLLCMTNEALVQDESSKRIAIGVYQLMDSLCSPVLYALHDVRHCQDSKVCPVFRAIVDKRRVPYNEWGTLRGYGLAGVARFLEKLHGEIESDYQWLMKELNHRGEKLAEQWRAKYHSFKSSEFSK